VSLAVQRARVDAESIMPRSRGVHRCRRCGHQRTSSRTVHEITVC